ncbi:MAG: N-6 DNA methylase [Bacteroidetes bacterium]|nr:N-6 DNA methylase [Bacteroidota bacterium]
MLDTQTKRRIDDCRDILVGKLPDPKAQIEQITIGLIYKFMDDMDKEAVELGGKAKFFSDYKVPNPEFPNDRAKDKIIEFSKYAWDKLMHPKVTATEMLTLYSEAIEGMEKNPNIPQLFRDIFNNAYLPYRDPETLKLFLKTIGEFEYTHSEKLGDAFEYLLSVMGSQGDAGQFRTPRHIIDFLVAIIDPDKTDTILDPACGTAGFLISAYKHILLKYSKDNKEKLNIYEYNKLEKKPFNNLGDQLTPDDRKKLIQNFVGYDISPDMVRLSLVNLYLHGFNTPNIHEYDTLSSEERWIENFDVVLANPPFMSPKGGIRPHKKFTISSNRSEVLFVDYIAEHLNPNGKAGIIVPEGIIFQSGTAYKDLRKMLVENHLYAVVSLPAGVFNPYSGVKTSILLMDKEVAKNREEILFIKIDNDGYNLGAQRTAVKGGQLEEAIKLAHKFVETGEFEETPIAHLVPKVEIAKKGDFNLSGERYKEQIQILTDFPLIDFEDALDKVTYSTKIKSSDYKEKGTYPVIDQSDNFIAGYWDYSEDVFKLTKPVTIFGDHTRCFKYVDFDFVLGADGVKILQPSDEFNPKFFYYLIRNIEIKNLGYSRHYKELKEKQIPLPPLSIQEEIVAEIEGYQKIINGAKAVVANYKPKIDIDPDWEMVELGDAFNKITTSVIPAELEESEVNYVGLDNISQGSGELIGEVVSNPKEIKSTKTVFKANHILYGKLRPNLNKVYFSKIEGICSTDIFVLEAKEEIEPKFFAYHFLSQQFNDEVMKGIKGAQLPRVGYEYFSTLVIPKPPTETQRQIVAQIDKEQALVNANKQLIEIFEQKIKDRIAKVWGVEKTKEERLSMAAEPQVEYEDA